LFDYRLIFRILSVRIGKLTDTVHIITAGEYYYHDARGALKSAITLGRRLLLVPR